MFEIGLFICKNRDLALINYNDLCVKKQNQTKQNDKNFRELYASYFLGKILVCVYTICRHFVIFSLFTFNKSVKQIKKNLTEIKVKNFWQCLHQNMRLQHQ